jgi:hypothetical protein
MENGINWNNARKSSRSAQGDCVEVAPGEDIVGVRDTKDRGGAQLALPAGQWALFLEGVKAGEFDL